MQLLKILDRVPDGIPRDDLIDCYVGIVEDLDELTRLGNLITIRNTERGSDTYYSRGFPFLTELSSKGIVAPNGGIVRVMRNVQGEIRRGDAIQVGEKWFRVSNALRGGGQFGGSSVASSKSVSSVRDLVTTKKPR